MVNKVILIGRMTADPQIRYTPGGASVVNFSLATNKHYTDKAGVKQQKSEFHRIVAWSKLADLCARYLTKGQLVYIEGELATREWTDKAGILKSTTEIIASTAQFLSGGNKDREAALTAAPEAVRAQVEIPQTMTEDDIPF